MGRRLIRQIEAKVSARFQLSGVQRGTAQDLNLRAHRHYSGEPTAYYGTISAALTAHLLSFRSISQYPGAPQD
jgi:hypothetical protein